MRSYSDAEIATYVASGDPLDKAGAYGIQNADFHPVARLEGCYASVMGLCLCDLADLLSQAGVNMSVNVPLVCRAATGIVCSGKRSEMNFEAEVRDPHPRSHIKGSGLRVENKR
jgi:hypothetical protein